MKKTLIVFLVLVIGLLTSCRISVESEISGSREKDIDELPKLGSSETSVTHSDEMLFDFTIRQELAGSDATVYQLSFFIDVSWNGREFEAASVFTREVQHHSGRYDVQEDVVINGRLSPDEKNIESLTFRNERTGEIYEMLIFELENIPFTEDNPYADSSIKFYLREGADSIGEHIKRWDEQARKGGDVTDKTVKFETMGKFDQEVEITVSFYYN